MNRIGSQRKLLNYRTKGSGVCHRYMELCFHFYHLHDSYFQSGKLNNLNSHLEGNTRGKFNW